MQILTTALLLAQTWVSPLEQSYGPYLAPASGGDPAVVASVNRVLLAWSELDPITRRAAIRTGVLDFDGRLVSEIHTLPAWQAGAEATSPMVATDGQTFAVAWREHTRVSAIPLDANGSAAAEPLTFGVVQSLLPLLWNGSAYQLAEREGTMTVPYAFDRSGARVTPPALIPAFPRFAHSGAQTGLLWASTPREYRCNIARPGCRWFDAQFIVEWEIVRGASLDKASKNYRYYTATNVVTAGDDDELAVVWRGPDGLAGLRVAGGRYRSDFTIDAPAEPSGIAFDGERWLVVFTRAGDVWGAFVDRTSEELTPFPITTGARTESNARATALAPGRFLVSYSSDLGPDDHRFAGRVVLTEPPPTRRRAMR